MDFGIWSVGSFEACLWQAHRRLTSGSRQARGRLRVGFQRVECHRSVEVFLEPPTHVLSKRKGPHSRFNDAVS